MTEATIQKFDINDAAEKLKAQIRSAFIELLTPEQFRDMVQTELKRFTQEHTEAPRYHGDRPTTVTSGFSKLCREVFEEYVKTELKTLLASAEYQTQWDNNRQQISGAIQAWLTMNSRALIESTVLALAGNATQDVVSRLRNL